MIKWLRSPAEVLHTWRVLMGRASDQRRQRAPQSLRRVAKGLRQSSGATSCNGLGTPGEGIRIEELTELSHHSLIQYRLPATGGLIPLLQIRPSKTDQERLLVVPPELADVLSAIMRRIRGLEPDVPLVVSYDKNERVYNPPMPLLFQGPCRLENRAVGETSLRDYLDHALTAIGAKDTSGRPLRYTFHDFRRIFITDAIMHGMPPHIAQLVAGHRDINTTMGYKAVYPEEVINGHRAFITRRRALRPAGEYRVPTDVIRGRQRASATAGDGPGLPVSPSVADGLSGELPPRGQPTTELIPLRPLVDAAFALPVIDAYVRALPAATPSLIFVTPDNVSGDAVFLAGPQSTAP